MSRDGRAALPHGATGLSAVCDCGISDHTHLLFLSISNDIVSTKIYDKVTNLIFKLSISHF